MLASVPEWASNNFPQYQIKLLIPSSNATSVGKMRDKQHPSKTLPVPKVSNSRVPDWAVSRYTSAFHSVDDLACQVGIGNNEHGFRFCFHE
jgi:hypothetical protein